MCMLAIMETDVHAIRIKLERGGFAAMRPWGWGWEGLETGRGSGLRRDRRKNSTLGALLGSFGDQLSCTLIEP